MSESVRPEEGVLVDPVETFGLAVEEREGQKMSPLFQGREVAEKFTYPWNPDRRAYGALPHLKSKEESLALFRDEARYFEKTYTPKEAGAPAWRDASFGEGIILFEAKFGEKLSAFAESILAHYPVIHEGKPGKEISISGLSGSGKSTALETARELYGSSVVEMDSDTVRYALLARMVRDVEVANGADQKEVCEQLLHNNISGALYLLLHHVTKELKARGYTIIRSSVMPETNVDVSVYVSHPDGIDPRTVTDEQLPSVAKTLFERTQARVHGSDNYDWQHAETVTEFNKMSPVTVQVPERVHGIFVKNIRDALARPGSTIQEFSNQKIDDPQQRAEHYRTFFKAVFDRLG